MKVWFKDYHIFWKNLILFKNVAFWIDLVKKVNVISNFFIYFESRRFEEVNLFGSVQLLQYKRLDAKNRDGVRVGAVGVVASKVSEEIPNGAICTQSSLGK